MNTKRHDFDSTELDQLLAASLEGIITTEQRTRLNNIMRSHPDAVIWVHDALRDEAILLEEIAAQHTGELLNLQTFLPQTKKEGPKSHRYYWGTLAALIPLFFIIWKWPALQLPPSHLTPSEDEPVARLVLSLGAEIEGQPLEPGSTFQAGDYQFQSGNIELEFRSGAQTLLEGPAHFTIENDMRLVLHKGRIRALIPEQAIGFTVLTSEVDIIDLGTEFGVAVDEDQKTEVHVFSGKVELHEENGQPSRVVTEGFAAGWQNGKPAQIFNKPDSEAFKSPQTVAYHRWQRAQHELLNDPDLLVYYDFNSTPDRLGNHILVNLAQPGIYDGSIHGPTQVSGRWLKKKSLLFENPDDRVAFEISEPLMQFTLAAWIKVNRFENAITALVNSNGNKSNHQHLDWQLRDNGGIRASSNGVFYINSNKPLVAPGQWIHLALTYDGEEQRIRLYVNGRKVKSQQTKAAGPIIIGKANIGHWQEATHWPYQRDFRGRIDEFFVITRKMETGEIRELFIKGSSAAW